MYFYYSKYNYYTDAWITDQPLQYVNCYFFPKIVSGTLYDLSGKPYIGYSWSKSSSTGTGGFYIYYGSGNSFNNSPDGLSIILYKMMITEKPINDNRFISLQVKTIKGKRSFKLNSVSDIHTNWYQPVQFIFNNKNYIGIWFHNTKVTAHTNNVVSFARVENNAIVWDTVIRNETGFDTNFIDTEIDFGSANQEVCEYFYDWIYDNTTEAKTAKIIIKEGNTTLAESPMIPPYTSISLATLGNRTTLTTNNGDEITFDTKDNFSGLSESKIALYPTIRDGTLTYFANTGLVTFYTCYKTPRALPNNFLCSFYRCDAEENRVDKTAYLSDKQDFYITLKDEAPILGMSIFLDLTNINMNWDIPKWNYCYLHKFNRWYFCELKSVYNNVWEFQLREDVLMSFKDQISGLQGMVDRNQSIFDRDIPDDLILTKAYPSIEHSELSPLQDIFKPDNELNDYYNYLIILRG